MALSMSRAQQHQTPSSQAGSRPIRGRHRDGQMQTKGKGGMGAIETASHSAAASRMLTTLIHRSLLLLETSIAAANNAFRCRFCC